MAAAYGKVGGEGHATTVVDETNTAKTMKSGSLNVFGTPAMCALMEEAACNALRVEGGVTSVGASMSIQHIAASSMGRAVRATATIIEVKKNSIQFNVVAKDSTGKLIGKGEHFRAIVDIEKFMKTASEKGDIGSL
jgi:fluoroacetyl-CoA thioesterase